MNKTYYINKFGSLNGDGSLQNPWSIEYLEKSIDHSGDIIIVENANYDAQIISKVYGSKENPVVIRPETYLGSHLQGIREDGKKELLTIKGKYSRFVGFECSTKFITNRTIDNDNPNLDISNGVYIMAEGAEFVTGYVHDVTIGISSWSPAIESIVFGNVICNIGWNNLNSSRKNKGHGHGAYSQNNHNTDKYKYYINNIIWGVASEGIQIYSQKGNIESIGLIGNTVFNLIGLNVQRKPERAFILGGYSPINDMIFSKNHTYKEIVQFGYGWPPSTGLTMTDNYFNQPIAISIFDQQKVKIISGNTFIKENNGKRLFTARINEGDYDSLWNWNLTNNKTSSKGELNIGLQQVNVGGTLNIKQQSWNWKNDKIEVIISKSHGIVQPSKYNYFGKMANVVIHNHDLLDEVFVDINEIVGIGERFEVRDSQNFSKVIFSGVNDGNYKFPMTLTEIVLPKGNIVKDHVTHSDKGFNVFVIRNLENINDNDVINSNPIDDDSNKPTGDIGSKIPDVYSGKIINVVEKETNEGQVYIEAITDPDIVGSVEFEVENIDGTIGGIHIENGLPYTLFVKNGELEQTGVKAEGEVTIFITPYEGSQLSKLKGETVEFVASFDNNVEEPEEPTDPVDSEVTSGNTDNSIIEVRKINVINERYRVFVDGIAAESYNTKLSEAIEDAGFIKQKNPNKEVWIELDKGRIRIDLQ